MQYVDGFTLADLIKKSPVDPKLVSQIFRQIVSAVAFAHSHGIIHRDLKPANIMIKDDSQIKVLDFGLAKTVRPAGAPDGSLSSRISQNGLIIGTVSYMSPEQLRGERLDFQTDIFSLGIILYELITGKNPFARNSQAETIASVLGEEPAPLTNLDHNVSGGLSAIVGKCLQKDKAKRFQSAAEITVYLENIGSERIKTPGPRIKRKSLRVAAILVFLCLFAITSFLYFPGGAKASHSLAILPIANESGDPGNDYLSDGLTESLVARLSGFSQIHVTSPNRASLYKDEIDPITIGAQLQVDVVMRARLFRVGNSLYLQAMLVNTADGRQLGSIDFETDKTNLINSEEMIANLIVSNLQITTSDEDLAKFRKKQPNNPDAVENFLRGSYYLKNRTKDNIALAVSYFNKAIDADPLYAKAWAGKSEALLLQCLPSFGSLTPKEAMSKARDAAREALKLDVELCEAHNSMGLIKLRYDWNWEEAEKSFLKAIELNPEYAPAHNWYAYAMILKGDSAKAVSEAEKARDLDPNTINAESNIGRMYYYSRQNDKAIQILTKVLETAPNNGNASYVLGLTYLQAGRYQDAVNIYEPLYPTDKKYFAAQLGYAYGRLNRKQDAQKILADLEEIARSGQVVPAQEFAIVYLGMREEDRAFELFTQSCRDRYAAFPFILTEFFFDDYRDDYRYTTLKACATPLS
jgi:serine/threonine-protein kinase